MQTVLLTAQKLLAKWQHRMSCSLTLVSQAKRLMVGRCVKGPNLEDLEKKIIGIFSLEEKIIGD